MNGYWRRTGAVFLCVCLLAALSACSDDDENPNPVVEADAGSDGSGGDAGSDADDGDTGPGDTGPGDTGPGDTGPGDTGPGDTGPDADADSGPDGGNANGLVLRGQLVPSGGLSMSRSFTLSGELSLGRAPVESASARFRLKAQPPTVETTP